MFNLTNFTLPLNLWLRLVKRGGHDLAGAAEGGVGIENNGELGVEDFFLIGLLSDLNGGSCIGIGDKDVLYGGAEGGKNRGACRGGDFIEFLRFLRG